MNSIFLNFIKNFMLSIIIAIDLWIIHNIFFIIILIIQFLFFLIISFCWRLLFCCFLKTRGRWSYIIGNKFIYFVIKSQISKKNKKKLKLLVLWNFLKAYLLCFIITQLIIKTINMFLYIFLNILLFIWAVITNCITVYLFVGLI